MIKLDLNKYTNKYINESDKNKYLDKINKIKERFNTDLSYWNSIDTFVSNDELSDILKTSNYIKKNCDVFIVIGIGGSYMGSKAVIEALSSMYNRGKPEIIFLGTNLTSEEYSETLDYISDKDIIVNVISKSGTTLEPSIAFSLILDLMNKKYNELEVKDRVIITTDIENGNLRKLVNEVGYKSFIVPRNIGGRFSVLTPVGLLPIAVSGIDITKLLDGARSFNNIDDVYNYSVVRDILFNKGKVIESFTVYNPKMYYFTEWLKQLFAETQGKNNKGILPISCINTRDLHSLGQFLQEGNDIIFETALGINDDISINIDEYNIDLNKLNTIAFDKVAEAHNNGNTPSNLIIIDEKNEYEIGSLIYFFILSAIVGALLINVNPFDQPGVEEYKKLIKNEIIK